MKKHVMFLAAATTLALASCSNDQDVELNKGEAISFRTAFAMPNSRGAETTIEELGDIKVTAMLGNEVYFKDVVFSYKDGSYSPADNMVYYWPGDNSTLTFKVACVKRTDFIGKAFSPKTTISDQEDLVYCLDTEGRKSDHGKTGVSLAFKHALSQIAIKANNTVSNRYKIVVDGAKIVGAKNNATFTNGTWEFGENLLPQSYEVSCTTPLTLDDNAQDVMTGAMLLPQNTAAWVPKVGDATPQAGAYLALKVAIQTKDGAWVYPKKPTQTTETTENSSLTPQPTAWVAVPVAFNWEAGKRYFYTLSFGPGAGFVEPTTPTDQTNPVLDGNINVTVTVDPWANATGGDINMPPTPDPDPTVPAAIRRK